MKTRIAKTRMPFRVAAFTLGILFVAVGLYRLFVKPTGWMEFGWAILIALTGLQFAYSALTEQRKSPFAWLRRGTESQMSTRFLVVEPVSFGIGGIDNNCHDDSPGRALNPYAPPHSSPTPSTAWEFETQGATPQKLVKQFLAGHPFIHYGVVFFLDSGDEMSVHAAIPLCSSSDQLVGRNTNEATRVLADFLDALPDARPRLSGRQLVVRMISSYDDLDDEVGDRVVVPPSSLHIGGG